MTNSFEAIEAEFSKSLGVETGRMFGSEGLKIGGKVFAMLVKEKLVVKVPASRAGEFLATGQASLFDPGHGRLMKEWVEVDRNSSLDWVGLAKEAFAFVQNGPKKK